MERLSCEDGDFLLRGGGDGGGDSFAWRSELLATVEARTA